MKEKPGLAPSTFKRGKQTSVPLKERDRAVRRERPRLAHAGARRHRRVDTGQRQGNAFTHSRTQRHMRGVEASRGGGWAVDSIRMLAGKTHGERGHTR